MGRWFARFLSKEGKEVIITGRDQRKLLEVREQLGVEVATNIEAARESDVVVLSVPIDGFETVVKEIAPCIRPGQIVVDVTSIKAVPVEIMHKYLKTELVLGIHPMFGPGASSLANHNFVLTPTSDAEKALAQKVEEYLEARDAKVSLMTPQEHDEMMTIVLGLSHFIALASADTLLSLDRLKVAKQIGGTTFKVLLALAEGVLSEDADLYASLHLNLPNVVEIERLFQSRVKTWANLISNNNRDGFVRRMTRLQNKFRDDNPDSEKAYQNLYRLIEG